MYNVYCLKFEFEPFQSELSPTKRHVGRSLNRHMPQSECCWGTGTYNLWLIHSHAVPWTYPHSSPI